MPSYDERIRGERKIEEMRHISTESLKSMQNTRDCARLIAAARRVIDLHDLNEGDYAEFDT